MNTNKSHAARRSSKVSGKRKYLGDPSDPHYVPSSPIISRQSLTLEQEEELTKSCTLVLTNVQHTDADDDDAQTNPTAKPVVKRQLKAGSQRDKSRFPRPAVGAVLEPSHNSSQAQKVRRLNEDAVAASASSKRDAVDGKDLSTPLTITSEVLQRPPSTRQNSAPRSNSKALKSETVYTSIDRSRGMTAATKSMTSLLVSPPRSQQHSNTKFGGKLGNINISHVEFNKSLPCLPHYESTEHSEKQNIGISRIIKIMVKKRPAPVSPDASISKSSGMHRSETMPPVGTNRKQKFNLASLFSPRKRQQTTQITVS